MSEVLCIDGKKLLIRLGISEENVTAEIVRDAFISLGKEEADKLLMSCVIDIKEKTLPSLSPDLYELNRSIEYCPNTPVKYDEVEIRDRIKRAKNYNEKLYWERELHWMTMCSGKHRRGKRKR